MLFFLIIIMICFCLILYSVHTKIKQFLIIMSGMPTAPTNVYDMCLYADIYDSGQ